VFRPFASQIRTPITGAPWYFCASGHITADSVRQVEAVVSAASSGQDASPVLDLTLVERVDREAGERLAEMVARGEVNLLGGDLVLPMHLAAVVRESHLEAVEAVLTLVRQRRHDGIDDTPALSALLERIRPAERQ
jgi:hypothetical protein